MSDLETLSKIEQQGATYSDIRYVTSENTSLEVKDGDIKSCVSGVDVGAMVRVLCNGNWGYFSTNDISERALEEAATTALKLAKVNTAEGKASLARVEPLQKGFEWKPKEDPSVLPIEEKRDLVMEMYDAVKDVERIKTVSTFFMDVTDTMRIVSSEGADVHSKMTHTYARASVVAKEGDTLTSNFFSHGGTGGMELMALDPLLDKAEECANTAVDMLTAKSAPSGKMHVIADPKLTGVFAHEAVGHATEGDIILSGGSCLEGKTGEKLGRDNVSIIDDPTIPGAFGSFPIDHEGVAPKKKFLFTNGVVTDNILNRETAQVLGLESNGGARAESFDSPPVVRMSNTYIGNGDMAFEELLEGIEYGVYAKGSRGGQVDTAKGSFQFNANEAFLIEKGEIKERLKGISLSGLTLETLHNIDAVGNDLEVSGVGFCGKDGQRAYVADGGPHVRMVGAIVGGM